jgi:hypothetical protein
MDAARAEFPPRADVERPLSTAMMITMAPREVSIFSVVSIWLPGSGIGFALPPRMSRRLQIVAITEPDKSDGRSVDVIDGVDT